MAERFKYTHAFEMGWHDSSDSNHHCPDNYSLAEKQAWQDGFAAYQRFFSKQQQAALEQAQQAWLAEG
jgi:uncharacterized protein YecT (DUF1311 family)